MRSAADVRWNTSQEGKINIHAVSAECDEIILSTEQGDILVAPTHLGLSFNLAALPYCKRFSVFFSPRDVTWQRGGPAADRKWNGDKWSEAWQTDRYTVDPGSVTPETNPCVELSFAASRAFNKGQR